ncbi:MAG: hypothetical protein K0Q72_2993, partial [Armatimonadetes bacterium]|nr:hypothetical protein [Armatimonadota bacterium]
MSPDVASPRRFGRTRTQAARGALWLTLLGCGAIVSVERYLLRPQTVVGELFRSTGIPPLLPLALGIGGVLACAAYGFTRSVRTAPRFALTREGLEVEGAMGRFTLEWSNLREAGLTATGALGLRVADRARILQTHRGTDQQRRWLETAAPYGEWDFLFER